MAHNTIIPKGREIQLRNAGWNDLVKRGVVKRKMVKNLSMMLIISNTLSLLYFPDNQGIIHLDSALYSTDILFHNWCSDLFDHIWNSAQPFDEKMLSE